MFDSIRSAMRSPLARPPGRRGWLRRFAPEWCALGVYLLMATIFVPRVWPYAGDDMGSAALVGAVWAYALAGLIFIVGPMVSGALAWGRERDRDTLEALVLTPAAREAVVRGRFWQGVFPWLRFCAYLLPIYLLLSGTGFFAETVTGMTWLVSDVCVLGSHLFYGLCGDIWYLLFTNFHRPNAWMATLVLLRFVNDITILLFACALAYFVSLRSRTSGRAVLLSALLVPGLLFSVLDLHDWFILLVTWEVIPLDSAGWQYILVCSTYLALGLAAFVARIWLSMWLVKRAARNFDWYALGEKPPPS